jgi:hypothetical protein
MLILDDVCFWMYIMVSFVCLLGVLLFEWWRRWAGEASDLYICVEVLFFSILYNQIFQAWARFKFINDLANVIDSPYEALISTSLWSVRMLPELIILIIIVWKMSFRACTTVHRVRRLNARHEWSERRKIRRREEDRNDRS